MANRVAGKSQADHLIDLALLVREPHIGEPGREIAARQPAEPVLRRHDQTRVMALLAERPNQLARHHQMAALGKRRARRDDGNRRHYS